MGSFYFIRISLMGILLYTVLTTDLAMCKKILVLCPSALHSHHNVYRSIVNKLLNHGHEIVYVTGVPYKNRTLNYTEIDTSATRELVKNFGTYSVFGHLTWMEFKDVLFDVYNQMLEIVLNQPEIQRLYADGEAGKFDLLIYEICAGPVFTAFAPKLNVPLIGISSLDLHVAERHNFATPILPSHPSNSESGIKTGTDLSFWQRVKSFVQTYYYIYKYHTDFNNVQRRFAKKYLGHVTPDIVELQRNTSLVLMESHPVLGYPKPDQPNFVRFSSIHLPDKPPKLPKELKAFLDNATKGFIYMSLGTSVLSKDMPKESMRAFINVFSRLPYKVLWKLENDDSEVNANNIYFINWVPQYSVLAHPNIKLFMFQGGLQSTDEAIHNAVPMIGFPCIFDQFFQVKKLVSLGVAKQLDLRHVTEETLNSTIYEVILDRRYKENVLKVRDILVDKPHNDLDNVIWWIEYVMRHNGAPFLQYSGNHDPWYKRYDIDVIVFLGNTLLLSAIFTGYIIYIAVSSLVRSSFTFRRTKKPKSH